MRHGYTNRTECAGDTVIKRYAGPAAAGRALTEGRALTYLQKLFPVPELVAATGDSLITRFVAGQHGQDLIDAGLADDVLAACGRILHDLQAVDPPGLGREKPGGVIQHGDFGPNNVIFAGSPMRTAAVLDWEFCATGPRITDVAWCEWIVRMHHPAAVGSLPRFFAAYGDRPPWTARRAEMLRRCAWLEDFCRRWDADHPGIAQWRSRREHTAAWPPLTDDTE